jgi:hypothetical protein
LSTSPSSPFETIAPPSVAPFDATATPGAQCFCGVDLGQRQDYTAICVVRRVEEQGRAYFEIGFLERLPLNTRYTDVAARTADIMRKLPPDARLILDSSGVGRAVADLFLAIGLSPVCCTITAGDSVTHDSGTNDYRVPKLHLVSRIQTALHGGQLRINKNLPEAATLVDELAQFRATVSEAGAWKFSAREGRHDDLLLAAAVAVFWAAGPATLQSWGVFEYYRQQFGSASGVDRELTALPAPLPPIEPKEGPGPLHGFSLPSNQVPRSDLVTLRAPAAISSASGLSGRVYVPDAAGNFTMTAQDAKVMLAHNWVRVTPPSP